MTTTRRLILIFTAILCVASPAARAQTNSKPVMGSLAVEWDSVKATTNEHGSVWKFFDAPTATLNRLECHVTTLNPGEMAHPPHQHPDEELIIIKEGVVEALVNGEMKRVGSGSVIFQASNQMHSIRNVGDTPATYHVIKWISPGMSKKKE